MVTGMAVWGEKVWQDARYYVRFVVEAVSERIQSTSPPWHTAPCMTPSLNGSCLIFHEALSKIGFVRVTTK